MNLIQIYLHVFFPNPIFFHLHQYVLKNLDLKSPQPIWAEWRCNGVLWANIEVQNGRFLAYTCTQQHSPSSVSPSIHHALPSSGSSYLLVLSLLVSPQRADTVPPLLLSKQTDQLPGSHPSSNGALISLLGHEESLGDRPH